MNTRSGRDSDAASPGRSGGGAAFFRSVFDGLRKRATEAIVIAIIAIGATVFWTSWDYLENRAKSFVIDTTIEELEKKQNRLIAPIEETLTHLRRSEIGALKVGSFVLTPSNPQYILPLYMPENHVGELSVELKFNRSPERIWVDLMTPSGKKISMRKTNQTMYLHKILRGAGRSSLEEVEKRAEGIRGWGYLTFSLAGPDAAPDAQPAAGDIRIERKISVNYLAKVSPALKMSSPQ